MLGQAAPHLKCIDEVVEWDRREATDMEELGVVGR